MLFEINTSCHLVSSWYKRALRHENGAEYDLRKINEIGSLEIPYLAIEGPTRHRVSQLWHSRRKIVRKLLKIADGPVSRILCGTPFAERTAYRGDHSSRSRFAP